jgi:type II secretory pathway pseudopilin PulG
LTLAPIRGRLDRRPATKEARMLMSDPYAPPAKVDAPPQRPRTSVLAILAFVFAFVFSPVGLLLGIVACIVVGASRGRLRGIGFAIAAIPVSLAFAGILAAIAIPSFLNYTRRAKSAEAEFTIASCVDAVAAFQAANGGLPEGGDWTPAAPPGEAKYAPDPALWSVPPWSAIAFSVPDPHYFRYRLLRQGDTVTCQAEGDLDGDGERSLYERSISVIGAAPTIEPGVRSTNPLE